jgi:autotransporter-associated beta strand protein
MGVRLRRLAAVLLAAAVSAGAAAGAPAGGNAEKVTISVTSILVSMKTKDVKPAGLSRGDRRIYRNTLRNAVAQFGKPKGAKVGSDSGTLTLTGAHTARYSGTARLPGGTLVVRGAVKPVNQTELRIAVVGGTGRYSSARGTLTVGQGDRRALNVYRLVLHVTVA